MIFYYSHHHTTIFESSWRSLPIFCQLSQNMPKVDFHLYGDGPMREDLQKYSDFVHFHGYEKNVINIWQKATLLCITSRDEGLPLVALEAMSHGVPVISYAVGGLPSLIQNEYNGFLIKPGDLDAIKKCISNYFYVCARTLSSFAFCK